MNHNEQELFGLFKQPFNQDFFHRGEAEEHPPSLRFGETRRNSRRNSQIRNEGIREVILEVITLS